MRKKLVVISNIAAPYQVAFAPELNHYYETQFWFYDKIGSRPAYWDVPLNDQCKVLDRVPVKWGEKYMTCAHLTALKAFDPDIVMLSSMAIPANYLAFRWARKHKKKTVIFTERFRNKDGKLRKKGLYMNTIRFLYRKADLIMVSDEDIIGQFQDTLGFKNKIIAGRYPSDIDKYFAHPPRTIGKDATIIFPNRLINIYNPLGALAVFRELLISYPLLKLKMNNDGDLKQECLEYIKENHLESSVTFLDEIKTWDDLGDIYRNSDIMLLPAKFSQGNFTIIEAMASGMGIVISDKVLGVGSLIEHGKNGFKAAEDVQIMKEWVQYYLEHPEFLIQHAESNKEKVRHLGAAGTARFYYELLEANL